MKPLAHIHLLLLAVLLTGAGAYRAQSSKEEHPTPVSCDTEERPNCDEIKVVNGKIAAEQKRPPDFEDRNYPLRRDKTLAFLYGARGLLNFGNRDYDLALTDLNRAVENELRLGKGIYYACRGDIYLRRGKLDSALADYKRSRTPSADVGRGNIFLQQKNYSEAFRYFDWVLNKDHRYAAAYFGRGLVYMQRADDLRANGMEYEAVAEYKLARDDFDSVVEILLGKTGSDVYRKLSKVSEKLEDAPAARKYAQQADDLGDRKTNFDYDYTEFLRKL